MLNIYENYKSTEFRDSGSEKCPVHSGIYTKLIWSFENIHKVQLDT